ncbi:MAG: hypothetical protein AABY10_06395 [Nanoarchaeota archaeon]
MALKINSSNRINRRYLLFENETKKEVESFLIEYLGILGVAKANVFFIEKESKTILSINRKELENVRAAVELSNKNIKIKRVSGTLKGLRIK